MTCCGLYVLIKLSFASHRGWTECLVSTNNKHLPDLADAITIILPAMPAASGGERRSLCDLSYEALVVLEDSLNTLAFGLEFKSNPVVIMEQTRGGLDDDECKIYWGGGNDNVDCEDGYRKGFFSQEFLFPSGKSCLLYDGSKNDVYYIRDQTQCNDRFLFN